MAEASGVFIERYYPAALSAWFHKAGESRRHSAKLFCIQLHSDSSYTSLVAAMAAGGHRSALARRGFS